jgi:predicted small metal-binding protein
MARKSIDCRDYPDDTGCTLYLSGEENEVVRAVAEHAASVHGMDHTPELREKFRSMLKGRNNAVAHLKRTAPTEAES